jgi:uncharacterized protein YndB with AHSA1/START domain
LPEAEEVLRQEHRMTDNAGGSTRVLGSLRSAHGTGVVRIEDRYDTDIDDLWSALTDPRRLARWYGEVDGDLYRGGRFNLYLEAAGLRAVGRVEVCDPPRRLQVVTRETDESWQRGAGVPPFDQTAEATLTADGGQTILVIEIRGMPLDKIAFYGAGWQIHAENLATYLAGRDPGDTEWRWDELVPPYQELATTIGQDRRSGSLLPVVVRV